MNLDDIDMDLRPFKLDIDELVDEFNEVVSFSQILYAFLLIFFKLKCMFQFRENLHHCSLNWQGNHTTLADMKKMWMAKKFSYIYEAKPISNEAIFMQSLYSYSISMSNHHNSLFSFYMLDFTIGENQ